MFSRVRVAVGVGVGATALVAMSGCASQTTVGSDSVPCAPDATYQNKYGRISARQNSTGSKTIAWGVYPNGVNDSYTVRVYINGELQDQKVNYYYPPHGSVSRVKAKKGKTKEIPAGAIFQLKGQAISGKNSATFWLTCRSR